ECRRCHQETKSHLEESSRRHKCPHDLEPPLPPTFGDCTTLPGKRDGFLGRLYPASSGTLQVGRVSVCCSGDPSADGLAELTMGVAARHSSPLQQTDSIRIAWLDAREYIKREDCMKARVLLLSAFAALLVAAANYADEHTKPASK